MAVLGNRATGLLDMLIEGFKNQGQNLVTPPMASPVSQATTPLQRAMNRPEVQLSQPSGSVMGTTTPSGDMYLASTTPEIQSMMQGRAPVVERTATVNAPQVVPARPDMGGQGVMQPGMDREKMLRDAEIASKVIETGDESLIERAKSYFGNRENMVKLALAFNSMRLNPDTALAATLGQELKDIRATSTDEALRNKTAAYFDNVDPKIAAAIRGGLDAKDAIALYRDKEKGVVVGKMVINPTTGDVIYDGSSEGSDLPDSVQKIIWGAKQLNLQPGTQAYQDYITSQLSKSKGMSFRMRPDGTVEFSEGGDLGSMTEGQGKGLMFSQRMKASQNILNQVEAEGTSLFNSLVNQIPLASNYLTSPEYKLYDQAKRDFINAVLRYESGAAIGAAEFDNAEQQYFPQPGDTPAVIAQKRANRDLAIQTMSAVAGPDAAKYEEIIRTQLIGPQAANWPAVGTEENGYRYIGGDPSIQSNWVKK